MSVLTEVYCFICLAWAVVMVTALFIVELKDAAANRKMRQDYWRWCYQRGKHRPEEEDY